MKRVADILFSFALHIIFPLIYILIAGGRRGIIKKIDSLSADTKGKIILCGFSAGILSVVYWFAIIYLIMNIALIILNLIPGIAI